MNPIYQPTEKIIINGEVEERSFLQKFITLKPLLLDLGYEGIEILVTYAKVIRIPAIATSLESGYIASREKLEHVLEFPV